MSNSAALEFSERRGFTLIGGHPASVGPVAVRADGSRESFEAVLAAAGQAMNRNCGMVVLSVFPDSWPTFDSIDARSQSYLNRVLNDHHVALLSNCPGDLADLVDLAMEVEASLLVLNVSESAQMASCAELTSALIQAPFDLFLLSTHDEGVGDTYSMISSATSIAGSSVRSHA
ncbi:MAG TPA: hypothetical protein VFS66_00040 [Acidimicrobiia bacterium]|nr:hypothetical protein [Acidimicrobiia bacterium]